MSKWWLALGCLLLALLFGALGAWQVERRAWKLDLIARVDARVHAAPVAPPSPGAWGRINARDDEYRRVRVEGEFLHEQETLVQAVTDLGPGYWLMTPLRTAQGFIMINRGFVPPAWTDPATRARCIPGEHVVITGLMRMSEPRGGFLRSNKPTLNRWYSRDVPAIAKAHGLIEGVAPFFIDAGADAKPGDFPVGGLTVIAFRNSHMVYALTWFALCGLSLLGVALALKPRKA